MGKSAYSPRSKKGIIGNFISKIEFTETCWIWSGSINQNGYGNFQLPTITTIASRASYFIFKEELPDGLFVCHKCDNPPCVNPDHLFLGTAKDNAMDCRVKKRCCFDVPKTRRTLSGSLHWSAKLTEKDVHYIRSLTYHDQLFKELAEMFSVNVSTIRKSYNGKYWKSKCTHSNSFSRKDGSIECAACQRIFPPEYLTIA